MTSKAFVAALALCGLSAAACGGAVNGATASSVRNDGPVSSATPQATHAASAATPAPAAGKSVPAEPLRGKVVVVDPGHNGLNYKYPSKINKQVDVLTQHKACDTTGTATDSGYSEAAFTWDVAQRLAKILKERGATVKLTRTSNSGVGPCITQRAAIGNKAKADAAISIHADGAPAAGHGFHVIMPKKIGGPVDPVVGKSRELGIDVRNSIKSVAGQPYSTYIGNKALDFRDDLGGLNLSTVPKVFVESGNMRNPGDAAEFRSPAFRQKLALALADGIQAYLN
ncbi:N-acetylmuramoyl-L-alanine amidase [Streptosporangium album]|uniref:N-acetylmuramoyl-L-alanine amidase n=1 Tax=Streptosporangium album TaxID=47479 RepID=A0A7W7W8N1_9ACTN|nr:N-acetylmuramoyl-L-alanine amidase [Streptosporangium album]MBB4938098.1 N-acetylmuramoyl-L-alanine amidase [Streptosporangium album]